jgi:hypothetical protein
MKVEPKYKMTVEVLYATELMTAIALLTATALRNLGLFSFFALAYGAATLALKYLPLAYAEAPHQHATAAKLRRTLVKIAVIGAVTLNMVAIIAPTYHPLEYVYDYIMFWPSPGRDWILVGRSNNSRAYLRADSVKKKNEIITFQIRLSLRRDLRSSGIAYLIAQASSNCATHSSISVEKVLGLTSTGKIVASFTPSAMPLPNRLGGLLDILNSACNGSPYP